MCTYGCTPSLQEWFKFVDTEKVLRQQLEVDLATLADEAAELRLGTIGQVCAAGSSLS